MSVQPNEMIALLNNYTNTRKEDKDALVPENAGNIAGDALYEAIKEMMVDMKREFPDALAHLEEIL
ncbi:MAG TPA: hypothetical protein PKL27_09335 [Nitrosomonas sp.]|nr:hypothetical protein [Nitrosomonas sp.]